MTSKIQISRPANGLSNLYNILACIALFLLALLPRAYALTRFVTADEAKWVYRSAQFLAALLRDDFAATSVNLTPAVTTTWLGSLGLGAYYLLRRPDLPLTDWLLSLPQFRVDLDVLAATRWPMIIFTSLGVLAVYWLARRLFPPTLAFLAAALVALDPHFIALSRILGHDAPAAVFITLSLLLLLIAVYQPNEPANRFILQPSALILSGIAAGLAFLSKAPALFLIPFAGLLFVIHIILNRGSQKGQGFFVAPLLRMTLLRFFLWMVVAYLTFIAFWPAAWVDPLGRPRAVFENAFLSATDHEEVEAESYWLTPDLGPWYYLVNAPLKLSPLVLIGVGLAAWYAGQSLPKRIGQAARPHDGGVLANEDPGESVVKNHLPILQQPPNHQPLRKPPNHLTTQLPNHLTTPSANSFILWLFVFVILFTVFMTLSGKRSPRYILPAFPSLAMLAAWGWYRLWERGSALALKFTPYFSLLTALFSFVALLILWPYAPYYFTYFNPLLGGSSAASQWVKIGWGEGLDQVGRFLQREHRYSRVGAAYASTIAPFFEGDLLAVTDNNLDYVVLYVKQVQSGEPSPTFIRYFEQLGALFSVNLNGLHYANVYPGPAPQPALALTPGLDHAILPKPLAFRPLTPYAHLGEPLEVDVLWLADDPLPSTPSTVTLQPLTAFDFLGEHNHPDGTPVMPRQMTLLAEGQGHLTRLADNLVVSRHRLPLPTDLARGRYALLVDGRPLGEIEACYFQVPTGLTPANPTFGDQLTLAGYRLEPTEAEIRLTLAWRAEKPPQADNTVFVQLLNAANERVTGVDAPPLKGEWPTTRWVKNEVVTDEMTMVAPSDLAPGSYKIIVGLYRPDTGQRLVLPDGADYWTLPETYLRK